MNKEKYINKLNEELEELKGKELLYFNMRDLVQEARCTNRIFGIQYALNFARLLDEPQKVKVPECVAEYIEAHHKWGPEIFIGDWLADNDAVYKWLYNNSEKENNRRFLIAVKAFVEGYEVEEETKWVVKDSEGEYVYDLHLFSVDVTAHSSNQDGFDALLFTDKEKAEAVANLIDGTVEKVEV